MIKITILDMIVRIYNTETLKLNYFRPADKESVKYYLAKQKKAGNNTVEIVKFPNLSYCEYYDDNCKDYIKICKDFNMDVSIIDAGMSQLEITLSSIPDKYKDELHG